MKQVVVSRESLETRVAVLEDGRVSELYVERPGRASLVGNVYKGRVENVLAGMDAAFVDIGLERNGFLHVDDVMQPDSRSGHPRKITELLQGGKEVLVQVTRDAMGNKGPRLTTQIGIAGRYVVYLPDSHSVGVSRRLDAAERERLRLVCKEVGTAEGGLIVRTAAEGADADAIDRDVRFLQRVWGGVTRRASECKAPALVYEETDLAGRAIRDLLGPGPCAVLVDDPNLHRRLVNYLHAVAPGLAGVVQLDDSGISLFALDFSIIPIAAVVIGGGGTLVGALIGAFILVPLSEVLRAFGTFRIVIYCVILTGFIVFKSEGIMIYLQRKYHQFERWVKV